MTQLCENCGRRFDAELTDGVCPHCGRFCSRPAPDYGMPRYEEPQPQPEQRTQPEQEPEPQPEPEPLPKPEPAAQQPAPKPNYKLGPAAQKQPVPAAYKEAQPRQKASPASWIVCGLLLVVLLFLFMGSSLAIKLTHTSQAEKGFVPSASVEMLDSSKPFPLGPNDRMVKVGEAQSSSDMRGVQKGCKLARVWFDVEKTDGYMRDQEVALYLQADGTYYEPVPQYKLEEVYPELAKHALEQSELYSDSMNEGWVYFVVPQDAKQAVLWVQERFLDEEYDPQSAKMRGFEFTLEEGSFEE